MRTGIRESVWLVVCLMTLVAAVSAQEAATTTSSAMTVFTYKPNYVPPAEILSITGARPYGGQYVVEWRSPEGNHYVDLRVNDAANLIIISGVTADVDYAMALVRAADIAPRQIEIEVKIVKISTSKARNIGFDWEYLLNRTRSTNTWRYNDADNLRKYITDTHDRLETRQIDKIFTSNNDVTVTVGDLIHILDSTGVADIRNAPRILTLNNRRANILDGQRIAYVAKYGVYTGLYETDTMDAGLTMTVTPSLAESGYITLQINAELTQMGNDKTGSLLKDGQMLENTVVVKDGESVLLGGLTQTVNIKAKKRFPLLGYVLPFLFSRETTVRDNVESYMVLTPRVVDFAPTPGSVVPTIEGNN
jgi:type II secretory pathway component GspD/PulD (secretin)